MSKRCYYEVLAVERSAGEEDLKKAFRRLAMKCHPDRCPDDPAAQERFKEAKEAYEVLSDRSKRALYDQHGHAAFEHGRGGGFNGDVGDIFGDIFSDIFGMGGGRTRARRGSDLRYLLELDLEEAVFGIEKSIEVPTLVECGSCKGSGSADGRTSTCTTCRGQGRVRMQNGIFSIQQVCPHCAGAGSVIANPCSECRGDGRVHDERTLSVRIPAGVDSGDRIRLTGQGEAGPAGTVPGDLYVEVRVREFMVGLLAVGLFVGVMVGRSSERARRGFKDYGTAKTAVKTGRKNAMIAGRKAAVVIAVAAVVMAALFMGAMNLPR